MMKTMVMTGMIVGSLIAGGYIPLLWGDSAFSVSSIIFCPLSLVSPAFGSGYKIGSRY
jgi:hypothetical protein